MSSKDDIIYKIGLYIRLSREDGDDLESESISNQRSILSGYLKANNLVAYDEYVDDGYSGGNFNRPGFQRLIEDIENKRINCVITKDLSRLGRDYIDTGRYIERYFPEHNIRYIAINDDIDTFNETGSSDLMPFRLGMNDMYAKDISKKVRSTLMDMKRRGKFCGSVPPYGYMRDKENKHKLIPDPNTAPVVKQIFYLYTCGYSSSAIAEILTREEIPTPIMLKNSKKKIDSASHPEIWKHSSVSNILKNEVYTGSVIQHKTQNINYKTKKRRKIPKDEWCIIENKHEPIIDKETFEIAQHIKNKANHYDPNHRKVNYTLSNLVYCKDCGARMNINYDKKRNRILMNCSTYRKFSKYGICFSHFINYEKLEKTIYNSINNLSYQYLNDKDEFESIIRKNYFNPRSELIKKIENINKQIELLKRKQDSLYDDKFNKIISPETYKRLFDKTLEEIKCNINKIKKYEKELRNVRDEIVDCNQCFKAVEDFLNIKNPTQEMLNKIIDKVYITKDKEVEIHFRIKPVKVKV